MVYMVSIDGYPQEINWNIGHTVLESTNLALTTAVMVRKKKGLLESLPATFLFPF